MFRWRKPTTDRKWKLILVSHTHWDREWYLPFQQFRANLVEAVDNLLELMADSPDYRYFTLDGQTVVLEDYLEVRPEKEVELRELIREGRVLIGPWYAMPDEFLVSGESLIRNFLEGRRTAARFGPVMNVGYVPDPFGHIAQLPQILRGFGIDSAVLWRGVGAVLQRDQALWEAPDGSSVLLVYMPGGYANAAVLPTAADSLMERITQIRAALEPRATTDHLLLMNGNDHMLPQPDVPAIVAEANRRMRDAEIVHGTLPMLIAGIRDGLSEDGDTWQRIGGELRSSELAHILAGVLSARVNLKQRNAQCEMLLERWAEPFSSFASLLSADGSGPAYPAAQRLGRDAPPLLRLAWRYLLKNQPHDSICGCSVDQVHQEMGTRYDWCQQIAEVTIHRSLEAIAEAVDTEGSEGGTSPGAVVVFNSEGGPRTDFVTATVGLPRDRSSIALVAQDGRPVPWQILHEHLTELAGSSLHRSEVQGYLRLSGPGKDWPRWKIKMLEKIIRAAMRGKMPELAVVSMDVVPGADPSTVNVEVEVAHGKEHDYDALSVGMKQLTNLVERGDAQFFRLRVRRRDQVEIGLVAHDVPAYGMEVLRFEAAAPPVPVPHHVHEERTLENEYLSLQVSPEDGTIRLIDRETGTIYWGLNRFEDGGDAGDEYTYSPPPDDRIVYAPDAPPTVTLEDDGPARQVLRVELDYLLPVAVAEDRQSRSQDTVPCRITTWLSLYPGVPRIDVRTTVSNQARDHRLRVLFPTSISADASHADGQFAVVERPVDPPAAASGWVEHPVATHPQLAFVDLSDGESGLMIANRGLREYEIVRQEKGPAIALTLLRCVGWLSRDDLATRQGAAGPVMPTPGAQMPGVHVFEYSIIPHPGKWDSAMHHAYGFARPLAARWTGIHRGSLGTRMSFLSVSPDSLLVSAVKQSDDGSGELVVRLYNPIASAVEANLRLFAPVVSAATCNLAEEPQEDLRIGGDGSVPFTAGPHKIVTLRLRLSPAARAA